jgi:hypothetical protein
MHALRHLTIIACVAATALPVFSHAQTKKVPGEKWKQSMSMEMSGMKMPARSFEVCVPVGKAAEALSRPPENNENCVISNARSSGNKFSADMQCTGKMPMEGHIESVMEGNRTITKMQMTAQGMTMVMNMDATKLGTACEAIDYSDMAAKANAAAATQMTNLCSQYADSFAKKPREVAGAAALYADKNGQCATHESKKSYCSAVQTPAGFMSLSNQEKAMSRQAGQKSVMTTPLTSSLQSCNLGTADALRTRLMATAEKDNDWDFQIAEGGDAKFAALGTVAKRECAGRSFTNQPAGRYSELCRKYGTALARGDRDSALQAAGVVVYGAGAIAPVGQGASTAVAEPAPAATGSVEPDDEAAAGDEKKSKTREALDKSKKKLKGLFGGGGD